MREKDIMSEASKILPFPLDFDYDYILDEADRKKFAPLQVTDEVWRHAKGWGKSVLKEEFSDGHYYRRRKSSGWVSIKERLPDGGKAIWVSFTDASSGVWPRGFAELSKTDSALFWRYCEGDYQIPPTPQPPRPAAEVAFHEYMKDYPLFGGEQANYFNLWSAAINWAKTNKDKL